MQVIQVSIWADAINVGVVDVVHVEVVSESSTKARLDLGEICPHPPRRSQLKTLTLSNVFEGSQIRLDTVCFVQQQNHQVAIQIIAYFYTRL